MTAWHTAVLTRMEQVPPLRSLLAQIEGDADDGQSAEEQLDAARAVVAAFGAAPLRSEGSA